jgi:hypothetical protein
MRPPTAQVRHIKKLLQKCNELTAMTLQFIEAKQVHNFSHWGLEHLRIQPLRYPPWISCKHAIADTFPNVKTFNGASREEYLSSNYMDRI